MILFLLFYTPKNSRSFQHYMWYVCGYFKLLKLIPLKFFSQMWDWTSAHLASSRCRSWLGHCQIYKWYWYEKSLLSTAFFTLNYFELLLLGMHWCLFPDKTPSIWHHNKCLNLQVTILVNESTFKILLDRILWKEDKINLLTLLCFTFL